MAERWYFGPSPVPERPIEKPPEMKITGGMAVAQMFQGVQTIQDLFRMDAQVRNIDVLAARLATSLGLGVGTAYVQAEAGPEGDADHLRDQIIGVYKGLYDFWKAGIWQGVGATWADSVDRFAQVSSWVYAYKHLMNNAAIVPRMIRHWNKEFLPQVPDTMMAWRLYREKIIDWPQFKTYAAYDGWSADNCDLLNEVWNREPGSFDAFIMWRKGLIKKEQRDDFYFLEGWEPDFYETLTSHYYYTFSPYELARMADFVELDQTWALKKLRSARLNDEDSTKMWQMLQLRPLREEVRSLTSKWTWRRRMGRATEDEISNAFIGYGLKAKERELLIEKANLDYEDELVNEWVDIYTWRFRTRVITEAEFLAALIDLGINEEKSNAIVELEKAKGYTGYY